MAMKIIGYARVSTDQQGDGSSLDSQAAEIRAWCQAHWHECVEVFQERVSGAAEVDDRPVLLEALALLALHGNDGRLVVVKRNRLARDVYVAAAIERVTHRRVISLDSQGEGPEGQLMRSILDAFAAYEHAQISWRCALGKAAKKKAGLWTGGRPPWGLRLVGKKTEQRLEFEERDAVGDVFEMHDAGDSMGVIAEVLNGSGLHTSEGKEFTHKQVSRIIAARHWYVLAGLELEDKCSRAQEEAFLCADCLGHRAQHLISTGREP